VKISAVCSDGEHSERVTVRDLSEGGAFVQGPSAPPIGTAIKMNLSVPVEGLADDEIEGRVVRVVQVDGDPIPDHITGLGLEFKLTPEQREKLRKILLKHQSGELDLNSDT
jgi:hypothetical protein